MGETLSQCLAAPGSAWQNWDGAQGLSELRDAHEALPASCAEDLECS